MARARIVGIAREPMVYILSEFPPGRINAHFSRGCLSPLGPAEKCWPGSLRESGQSGRPRRAPGTAPSAEQIPGLADKTPLPAPRAAFCATAGEGRPCTLVRPDGRGGARRDLLRGCRLGQRVAVERVREQALEEVGVLEARRWARDRFRRQK